MCIYIYIYIYIDKVTIYIYIYIYTNSPCNQRILSGLCEGGRFGGAYGGAMAARERWKNPLDFFGKMMKHMETTWKNHGNCQVKRMNMMEHDGT